MTTHDGDVTAAHNWDEPAALRRLFEEPGALERVSQLAEQWCQRHLGKT